MLLSTKRQSRSVNGLPERIIPEALALFSLGVNPEGEDTACTQGITERPEKDLSYLVGPGPIPLCKVRALPWLENTWKT